MPEDSSASDYRTYTLAELIHARRGPRTFIDLQNESGGRISDSSWGKWASGGTTLPRIDVVPLVARILGVSVPTLWHVLGRTGGLELEALDVAESPVLEALSTVDLSRHTADDVALLVRLATYQSRLRADLARIEEESAGVTPIRRSGRRAARKHTGNEYRED